MIAHHLQNFLISLVLLSVTLLGACFSGGGGGGSSTPAATEPAAKNDSLAIAKTLDLNADEDTSGTVSLNDTLTYSVTVTNDGNTTLNNVVVSDTLITPNNNTCLTLAPLATCVLTGTHVVSQAEVDAGSIDNTGSVTSDEVPGPTTDLLSTPVTAGSVFAVDANSNLISFDRNFPATLTSGPTAITGFVGTILGADFRPADGQFYMLTNDGLGSLYTVDTTTGVATLVSNLVDDAAALPVFAGLVGNSFAVDFNPVTDRLRVTSDMNQNLRINVDDGMTVDDTDVAFAGADVNNGATPNVVASAYANSVGGGASPILYNIDSNLDILTTQLSQIGTLSTVGNLGFNTDGNVGFDVDGSNDEALAALNAPATSSSSLFTIDLVTGTATNRGVIGDGTLTITSLAIPTPIIATVFVTDGTNLRSFAANVPEILRIPSVPFGGAFAGNLLGMDFRPSNGMLYILTDADADAANGTGTLYTVNTATGVATLASNLSTGLVPSGGNAFGMDFDPVTDLLRVVDVANASNLSIDVDTGIVTTDTNLSFGVGEDPLPVDGFGPRVSALAYSNNTDGAVSTALYAIDGLTDFLYTINPVNTGNTQSVGALVGDVTASRTSFDVSDLGLALVGLTPPGTTTTLNSIDLATGAATPVGVIGDGSVAFVGMSIAPTN